MKPLTSLFGGKMLTMNDTVDRRKMWNFIFKIAIKPEWRRNIDGAPPVANEIIFFIGISLLLRYRWSSSNIDSPIVLVVIDLQNSITSCASSFLINHT
jgi:hypothetical protein